VGARRTWGRQGPVGGHGGAGGLGEAVRGQSRAQMTRRQKDKAQGGQANRSRSPSAERLPTTRPATGEGLFLGMGSLMPLNMLHTPNMKGQCKPIYKIEQADGLFPWRGTDLKRLLQYLHGSALGFWCRVSPFSSAGLDGGDASIDWSGNIAQKRGLLGNWGIGTETVHGQMAEEKAPRVPSRVGERGSGGRGGGGDRRPNTAKHGNCGVPSAGDKWPNQAVEGMPALIPTLGSEPGGGVLIWWFLVVREQAAGMYVPCLLRRHMHTQTVMRPRALSPR
jgi:hypothetical protein